MAIVADLGTLQRLVGIVGDGHLRELALTRRNVEAAEAMRIGLVNHAYASRAELDEAARRVAAEMASNSPLVLADIKDVLDAERDARTEPGVRYVALWNAAFLASEDLAEARQAFIERRRPDFAGR
ncbi:enoyl-CoA hydratase-related protein [Streptomyces sp. NPDC058335]|uniref:enoyl-CoA hydratase-related protein n=1 Tax=Streptomyces sp. NPDC058335 TaxID=3346451 RepID=UPI003668EDB6